MSYSSAVLPRESDFNVSLDVYDSHRQSFNVLYLNSSPLDYGICSNNSLCARLTSCVPVIAHLCRARHLGLEVVGDLIAGPGGVL